MATRINFPVPTNLGNLYDPVLAQDGATKNWVEGVQQAESGKNYCAWGTTADILLNGLGTQAGGEWTANLNAGDRILVKSQVDASKNGIYVAASGAWSRALDANTWAKIVSANLFVNQGLSLGNTGWVSNVPPVGTLETTAINFIQFTANAGNFWPVGYGTISATNAKLGASNKPTIIGGNNADCIVLGDTTTESVATVSGIPISTQSPYNTQNNAGGIGVFGTNVYVAVGQNKTTSTIYTGPIASPTLSAWNEAISTTGFPSFFVKINGDGTYVTTNFGSGTAYTVKVGTISGTSSVSTTNNINFYNLTGLSSQIIDITYTGTSNNSLHVIASPTGEPAFFAEYGVNTSGTNLVLTNSGNPLKIAPNPGSEFWLDCAFSANRVSYAIDTSGSLYSVDFSFTTPTVSLAVSGFINVNGPRLTFLNANANYVVAIGADNNISLYNISTKAVTTFSAVPLITYPFGVAVDTTGLITVVGANSSGLTVYLSQPSLQVIAQFVVPAQPTRFLDSSGNAIGNNQLFYQGANGLVALPASSTGQVLLSGGASTPPYWGGSAVYTASTGLQNLGAFAITGLNTRFNELNLSVSLNQISGFISTATYKIEMVCGVSTSVAVDSQHYFSATPTNSITTNAPYGTGCAMSIVRTLTIPATDVTGYSGLGYLTGATSIFLNGYFSQTQSQLNNFQLIIERIA